MSYVKSGLSMYEICKDLMEKIKNPQVIPLIKQSALTTLENYSDLIIHQEDLWQNQKEQDVIHNYSPNWKR